MGEMELQASICLPKALLSSAEVQKRKFPSSQSPAREGRGRC